MSQQLCVISQIFPLSLWRTLSPSFRGERHQVVFYFLFNRTQSNPRNYQQIWGVGAITYCRDNLTAKLRVEPRNQRGRMVWCGTAVVPVMVDLQGTRTTLLTLAVSRLQLVRCRSRIRLKVTEDNASGSAASNGEHGHRALWTYDEPWNGRTCTRHRVNEPLLPVLVAAWKQM